MEKWNILERKDIFKGRVFTLQSLKCSHEKIGITHEFNTIATSDWMNIVPVTTDGKIIMVKQHRLGTDEITIETPGGLVDEGEDPDNTANRELLEETGYTAEKIVLMKRLRNNPAILNNDIHYYLATGCVLSGKQNLDLTEDIEVECFSPEEISGMIADGRINHSIVVLALQLYFNTVK